jgi:hypothetical protein
LRSPILCVYEVTPYTSAIERQESINFEQFMVSQY